MARKLTEQEIIDRINNKFPNKFDFSKWNFAGYTERVTLICKDCGSEVNIPPSSLLASQNKFGCKQCYLNSKPVPEEKVIREIKSIYGEDRFDFSKFTYKNMRTESILICNKCGNEFKTKVANLVKTNHTKEPCSVCYRKSISKSQDQFIKEIHNKYGNKFDTSEVNYVNAKTETTFICNDCGTKFKTTPDNLLTATIGCPTCADISRANSRRHSTEEYINLVTLVHKNKYDYYYTNYTGQYNPVTILCPDHGSFEILAKYHLKGSGCPRCKTSKGEFFIENFLKELNITYTQQFFINHPDFSRGIIVDFKVNIGETICFIEYNGIQHYQPIGFFGGEEKFNNYQIPRDNALREYCKEQNIPLLEIKYTLKDNEIKDTIKDFLISNGFHV